MSRSFLVDSLLRKDFKDIKDNSPAAQICTNYLPVYIESLCANLVRPTLPRVAAPPSSYFNMLGFTGYPANAKLSCYSPPGRTASVGDRGSCGQCSGSTSNSSCSPAVASAAAAEATYLQSLVANRSPLLRVNCSNFSSNGGSGSSELVWPVHTYGLPHQPRLGTTVIQPRLFPSTYANQTAMATSSGELATTRDIAQTGCRPTVAHKRQQRQLPVSGCGYDDVSNDAAKCFRRQFELTSLSLASLTSPFRCRLNPETEMKCISGENILILIAL